MAIDGGKIYWGLIGAVATLTVCVVAVAIGGATGGVAVAKSVWKLAVKAVIAKGLVDLVINK
ncbi:MAG: hypothetical protein GY928_22565 [Colwellia sp.]|nr:hypothetical protein [Colwellia sp.]